MKFLYIALLTLFFISTTANTAFSQTDFLKALETCNNYTQVGSAKSNDEFYDIKITLKKIKDNKCQYKETISQSTATHTLTCNFSQAQIKYIIDSMERFYKEFPKQIAKNRIFEAKLTSNGEVFQKYLIDKTFCSIEQSKQK